jgi:hypothetical protein
MRSLKANQHAKEGSLSLTNAKWTDARNRYKEENLKEEPDRKGIENHIEM